LAERTITALASPQTLTRDQWAWEFLRRNPEYRADYQHFINLWRALEADYGVPPQRDYPRWKQDPRAYGPLPGADALDAPSGELCLGDDERVLLECWMGAKWGFYKFPLDPLLATPASPDALAWRPPPATEPLLIDTAYRLDITFDLSLPLPPQLETAKFRLVSHATELRRSGLNAPFSVVNQRARWTQMLRLLDAAASGEAIREVEAKCLCEAQAMVRGGYLTILRLADAN